MSEFDAKEAAGQVLAESRAVEAEGKKSASTALVELAQERYTFGVSDMGETFALPKDGPRVVAMLRGGKTSLRALLAREFYQKYGKAPAQQALADALNVIEGFAQEEDETSLYLRVARCGNALWLDMGDQTGRAIKIVPGRWTVEATAPVLFKRTALNSPLPEPRRGGDLGDLWAWLNVSKADRPLVAAWLVTTLFANIPHPVLAITGEQGTGKTTAEKILAGVLDPSPVQVRKAPRDPDSWVTAASGSWVVGLDNLSAIPLWLSDSLCRAVTGDGDVRRKLYTDGDFAVFAYRRCVIINGIDLGALNPDLADRLLPIGLDLISEEDRTGEDEFAERWREVHPLVLGAVLDLAAETMAALPSVRLDSRPRMADFARILAAVDGILGTDGLARYALRAVGLSAVSLQANPFVVRLTEAVKSEWTGTSAELLRWVTPSYADDWRPPKDWPANAAVVTTTVRRFAPALRKQGWTVDDLGDGNHEKLVRWRIAPPGDVEPPAVTRPEMARNAAPQPPRSPQETDITGAVAGTAGTAGAEYGPTQDEKLRSFGGVRPEMCATGGCRNVATARIGGTPLCTRCEAKHTTASQRAGAR